MEVRHYTQEDIQGKRVLLRCDLDVSVNKHGVVDQYHDLRLERVVPTLSELFSFGAKQVVIIGHRGRPKGEQNPTYSLAPVRDRLIELAQAEGIDEPIVFINDILVDPRAHYDNDLVMLENLRFWPGEEARDSEFANTIAEWGEVYVNDAFGSSHRSHTSVSLLSGIMTYSFAGPNFSQELSSLQNFLDSIVHPFVAVLGGAKIATKLPLIASISREADHILVGGALANTILASRGLPMGKSLVETAMLKTASELTADSIVLPVDALVSANQKVVVDSLKDKDAMLDIGPETINVYTEHIAHAKTILWNGPMGKFEDKAFAEGTNAIAKAIAHNRPAYTLAGGGETIEALERLDLVGNFDFVSTGGGAMLTYLSGGDMPGLAAL